MSRDRVRAPEPAPPSALFAPFQALRAPDLQLVGSHALPDRWTVFALVMAGYFLIMSGVVYDVLHEPDSMGVVTDPRTGERRTEFIKVGAINEHHAVEGFAVGLMICVGGGGFMVLDLSHDPKKDIKIRMLMLVAGGVMIVMSFNLVSLCLRIKLPNYMNPSA